MKEQPAARTIEETTYRIELTRKDDIRGAFVAETFGSFGVTGIDRIIIKDVIIYLEVTF